MPIISDDEIRAILATAKKDGDRYTVVSAKRALRGNTTDRLACAMILGR